jgi:hypothetical protein
MSFKEKIIIGQVKKVIAGAINHYAKENNVSSDKVRLCIVPKNKELEPNLLLLISKPDGITEKKAIPFSGLITNKVLLMAFGSFDFEEQTPIWIQKFLIKASKDYGDIDPTKTYYTICLNKNELYAFMYIGAKMVDVLPDIMRMDEEGNLSKIPSSISLDYILTTK